MKSHVLLDSTRQTVVIEDSDLKESAWFLMCSLYGTVCEDDCVDEIVASIELCNEHLIGEIVRSWASEPESCPKDDDTLDLLIFSEDVLCRMKISTENSKKEYIDAFVSHISDQFKEAMKV